MYMRTDENMFKWKTVPFSSEVSELQSPLSVVLPLISATRWQPRTISDSWTILFARSPLRTDRLTVYVPSSFACSLNWVNNSTYTRGSWWRGPNRWGRRNIARTCAAWKPVWDYKFTGMNMIDLMLTVNSTRLAVTNNQHSTELSGYRFFAPPLRWFRRANYRHILSTFGQIPDRR